MQTSLIRTAFRCAAFIAVVATPVSAQQPRQQMERALFTWNGRVDNDVRVVMRRGAIRSELVSGVQTRIGRVGHVSPLPRRDGTVRIELLQGRGTVTVVQQPSTANDYTTIIQVSDAAGGADLYRFNAYFDPTTTTTGGEVIGTAPNAGDVVLHFSGSVDRDIVINLRGARVRQQLLAGAASKNVQASVPVGLPQIDHQLSLRQREGRGTVTITQQPSESNNYTAVVRVRDSRPGFGFYDFDLVW